MKLHKTKTANIWKDEDGIIMFEAHENAEISLKDIEENTKIILKLKGKDDMLLNLSDMRNMIGMNQEARKFAQESANKNYTAVVSFEISNLLIVIHLEIQKRIL